MPSKLDKHLKQTNRRLLIGFVLILFVIGDGLIYLIYGKESAILGLVCIGFGFFPMILIWGSLNLIEKMLQKLQ